MGASISTAAAAAMKEEARRLLPRPRPACELASSSFLRPDAHPTRPQEHLDYLDGECEDIEDNISYNPHWSEEGLAAERRLLLKALELYNALHPGNEYELVPGVVVRSSEPGDNCCWTHGNFVARPKRSGCFSFLPAPRALFFFEHVNRADFQGAVTCIRLDEPVTEACNLLGFPLGWGTRRHGHSDCVCKTCYRRFDILYRCLITKRTCSCGDSRIEEVCQMCYERSDVLHPFREEFHFGYRK